MITLQHTGKRHRQVGLDCKQPLQKTKLGGRRPICDHCQAGPGGYTADRSEGRAEGEAAGLQWLSCSPPPVLRNESQQRNLLVIQVMYKRRQPLRPNF